MNITALKYFKEVVETKSISKAAQNSHISQSALSQIMQKLEAELGYQLLNRSNKGVHPTEMGKIVYKYSGTMSRLYNKMTDELFFNKQKLVSVRINGYPSFINYSLPCIMYKIKKKFPMYKFELHSKTNEETFNDLINEVTDLGFVSEKPCDDNLKYEEIGKERIVLIAHKDSRVPNKIKLEELFKYEIVLLDNSLAINQFLAKKLKAIDLSLEYLNIMFEVDTIAAVKSSIRNNLGLSFLPYMSIKKELYEKEFRIVEVEEFSLDYNLYLTTRKNNNLSESLDPIIKYFISSGSSEFC